MNDQTIFNLLAGPDDEETLLGGHSTLRIPISQEDDAQREYFLLTVVMSLEFLEFEINVIHGILRETPPPKFWCMASD